MEKSIGRPWNTIKSPKGVTTHGCVMCQASTGCSYEVSGQTCDC